MSESDWKAFLSLVPVLRERYLKKINAELKGLLDAPGLSATERFWNAHQKVTEEASILKQCLDGHRRSRMISFIHEMLACGLMDIGDLTVFSEELQEKAKSWHEENTAN
ncbi:MAG: hypothetical protein ACOYM3_14940 [Terrimicrobiaceae bacterium]